MENSQVKLPKAAYFDSRIDCRIANPAMFRAAIQLPLNDAACFAYRGGVMKTLKILIFVVLALSMVTGCMDFVPPRQEAVEVEIEIEPVLTGKGEMTYFEGFTIPDRVITSVEKWNELKAAMRDRVYGLNTFDETDIDFSAYQVIAIFDEMHGNGGWSIDITGIVEYSDRIVISVTHLKTGDPSRVFTQPYHIVRIPASSKEIVFQEEDNGYDGEPKEISFTEYSLAKTSCQWTKLNNNDEAVVINSNEELNRYVTCTDNDYPAIDFSKYTLLVAHGTATSSVVSVNCSRLQQISEQGYTMNVDLVLGNATVMSPWQVVLITDKINAQGVILNLNKHFGTDNTLPACTTRTDDAVRYLTDYHTTILKEYSQDRSLSSHIVIAKLFDDTEPTAYLTVEHFSTYRICNYPQYAKEWDIPGNGLPVLLSGKVYPPSYDPGFHPDNQAFFDLELTILIPRAGQFSTLQTDAVRRPIWITPNKPQAQFGGRGSALPELRSSSTPYGVVSERYTYPGLRFACTGLSKLDAYGVKRHEASLARAQYKTVE